MAPKTRAKKPGKENVNTAKKPKLNNVKKISRPVRKPLGDKTNSASDDNSSIVVTKKVSPPAVQVCEKVRPRRERRVPNRFVANKLSTNVSNSSENVQSPTKDKSLNTSNISRGLENSLLNERPKRISKLPARLEDHSISPSKFIPVQPCSASTPIIQKQGSKLSKIPKVSKAGKGKTAETEASKKVPKQITKTKVAHQKKIDSYINKSPDTNNNPKTTSKSIKSLTAKASKPSNSPAKKTIVSSKIISKTNKPERAAEKSFSFRVLENKKSENNHENKDDIYEFTFDPNEEPKHTKKKRKRIVNKKPSKPKTVVLKSNYDKNLAQSLKALKSAVEKKVQQQSSAPKSNKVPTAESKKKNVDNNQEKNNGIPVKSTAKATVPINQLSVNSTQSTNHMNNHASVRIEDIAAQFEPTPDHHEIDYSPVNSPNHCPLPETSIIEPGIEKSVQNNDPLNLQNDLSFFDDQPVASSSMNVSARHPTASPWRVEFQKLPIKWNVNTYVKPNMTPAVECSYVDFNNSKKKHVYTDILPDKSVPDAETISTRLKQTSIISFIKEVVNRSMNKKKKKAAVTPTKQNSLFEDTNNSLINNTGDGIDSPRKSDTSNNQSNSSDNAEKSSETPVTIETRKRKNEDPIDTVSKAARKENDQTLFGFDDSENCDQENVSPKKIVDKRKRRNLRSKGRSVLQELNKMTGPTRAVVPATAKLAMNSEVVNKMYEELKSAATAPVFPEKNIEAPEVTNVGNMSDDESPSVHLFEDIELVHHLKPTRKSYGKAKKVTFRHHSNDSDASEESGGDAEQDSYDDLADLSFEVPVVKAKKMGKKKLTKKQKVSKKEEKEVEEWAAQFNSMCEDIDNVDLVVE